MLRKKKGTADFRVDCTLPVLRLSGILALFSTGCQIRMHDAAVRAWSAYHRLMHSGYTAEISFFTQICSVSNCQ